MHEWQITQELVEQVCSKAKENNITKVTKIEVELGRDAHLTEESLCFCFQMLSKETIAEGAQLQIKSSDGGTLTLITIIGE